MYTHTRTHRHAHAHSHTCICTHIRHPSRAGACQPPNFFVQPKIRRPTIRKFGWPKFYG